MGGRFYPASARGQWRGKAFQSPRGRSSPSSGDCELSALGERGPRVQELRGKGDLGAVWGSLGTRLEVQPLALALGLPTGARRSSKVAWAT